MVLVDDWKIEEKVVVVLNEWGLVGVFFFYFMYLLSGGEKIKVFLVGIIIYFFVFILMDEFINYLDDESCIWLYCFIIIVVVGILVVSYDWILFNLFFFIYEFIVKGVIYYVGNYDFYKEQKKLVVEVL